MGVPEWDTEIESAVMLLALSLQLSAFSSTAFDGPRLAWCAGALLFAGCFFDASGLAPSAPPDGEPRVADRGAVDRSLEAKDQEMVAADKKTPPPPPGDSAPPPCAKGLTRCKGECVDFKKDRRHCGKCDSACKGNEDCMQGHCCPKGSVLCGGCTDVQTSPKHCGKCGSACPAPNKCVAGKCENAVTVGCASGKVDQSFNGGMVGCSGVVTWPKRTTLCNGAKYVVCSAQQWVTLHGPTAPKFNYWTNDELRYLGNPQKCLASPSSGHMCYPSRPMRVCGGNPDPLGNTCTWSNCGYIQYQPNHYFGGCNDNTTAGALCCPK